MENMLRKRIGERLETLKLNPTSAAIKAGLNRYIVSDLMSGRKETIRQNAVISLSSALECDPEYLVGTQAEIRRAA